jgi:hypothetical protein
MSVIFVKVQVSLKVTAIVVELKLIVLINAYIQTLLHSKDMMNVVYVMDQVSLNHGVTASSTLSVVIMNVVEKTTLMNAESVTVKVLKKVSAHVIDKLLILVVSAVDQVLLNLSAIVSVTWEIVKVSVAVQMVSTNAVSVKVLDSELANVTVLVMS